jgi:uncharacterized Tic20 family protein
MSSRSWAVVIFGVVLLLAGTVFALQGAGYVGGSSMTGNSFWVYAGGAVVVLGLVLILIAAAKGSRNPRAQASVPTK